MVLIFEQNWLYYLESQDCPFVVEAVLLYFKNKSLLHKHL